MSELDIIKANLDFTGGLGKRLGAPPGGVVHNSGGTGSVAGIHAYHKSLGWRGFAYHYYNRLDGRLYLCRPEWAMGGHTLNYGHWLGICFEGNYNSIKEMPDKQFATGVALLKEWRNHYGDSFRIKPHREMPANSTDCPGRRFPWDELMKEVNGPSIDIVILKKMMIDYARDHNIEIPKNFKVNDAWEIGAKTLMDRVSNHLNSRGIKVPRTAKPNFEVYKTLMKGGK